MSKQASKKKGQISKSLAGTLSAFDSQKDQPAKSVAAPDEIQPDPAQTDQSPSEEVIKKRPAEEVELSDQPADKSKSPLETAPQPAPKKKNGGQITTRITKTYQSWRKKISPEQRKNKFPQRFKEWLIDTLTQKEPSAGSLSGPDRAFTTWLADLSVEEVESFSRQVANFCSGSNFELAWLVDSQLDNNPELKHIVEGAVVYFCRMQWQALLLQDDIKVLSTFWAWQTNPAKKEQQELGQQLFVKLLEKGLLSVPPPELFLAPEKERQSHMAQAIREFAVQDRQTLNATLKEIIFAPDDTSASTEEATPPEPASAAASG